MLRHALEEKDGAGEDFPDYGTLKKTGAGKGNRKAVAAKLLGTLRPWACWDRPC